MTVRIHVQSGKRQIIVPLRLDRAVTGAPVADAPDLDHRGFLPSRASGLNATTARGGTFGITVGDTVRVKVVREDLDAAAPLFITLSSSSNPQLALDPSIVNTRLPADGVFRVRAVSDQLTGQQIQVRLGGTDGPILAEVQPHVFSPLTLNITPHICTIHAAAGPPGTGTAPNISTGAGGSGPTLAAVFAMAEAVWRPAGIRFNVAAAQQNTYYGFTRDDIPLWNAAGGPGTEIALVNQNQVANTVNIYFVRYMHNSLGVGVHRDGMAAEGWSNPGIIIGVNGDQNDAGVANNRSSTGAALVQELANDVAHEIGHFLTLSHIGDVNNPGRSDTFSRRCLMHPNNLLPNAGGSVRFDDIGYGLGGSGSGHRGCLLTLKAFSRIGTDGEVVRARRRFRSPRLY